MSRFIEIKTKIFDDSDNLEMQDVIDLLVLCEDLLSRLARYKQAEDEGRILPVKTGDIAYYVTDQCEDEPPHIGEFEIQSIKLDIDGKIYIAAGYNDFDEVGTQWALLTRAETERILKEKLNS